ncbi:MAG: hypothetical protein K1X75_00955 [Leptospirales bacterium]|nr:hypothetical protein [Leptospirales bacterium]
MRAGETLYTERSFTRQEILNFAAASGDTGEHHVRSDGPLIAHGLLVASLPTMAGGQISFLARSMRFEFVSPVYEGDHVVCEICIDEAVERRSHEKLKLSFVCRNQRNEVVMRGASDGIVRKAEASGPGKSLQALRRAGEIAN